MRDELVVDADLIGDAWFARVQFPVVAGFQTAAQPDVIVACEEDQTPHANGRQLDSW